MVPASSRLLRPKHAKNGETPKGGRGSCDEYDVRMHSEDMNTNVYMYVYVCMFHRWMGLKMNGIKKYRLYIEFEIHLKANKFRTRM